jgi:hypothetical protein
MNISSLPNGVLIADNAEKILGVVGTRSSLNERRIEA